MILYNYYTNKKKHVIGSSARMQAYMQQRSCLGSHLIRSCIRITNIKFRTTSNVKVEIHELTQPIRGFNMRLMAKVVQ